jgi:thioesterase domain-containing protein/acyl carrier protein
LTENHAEFWSFRAVTNTSTSSNIELLTYIWKQLLQQSVIGPDDNFFDLGGDSALAVQLFAEISQSSGRQLPAVMIYHVPTIALQAALLDQPATPELSPLVLLKSGERDLNLFIVSGLGGGPAEFFQLSKYLRGPHFVYGLQAKGIEGFDEPSARIEEMADFYMRAISRVQPRGPYNLIGYSLGGLVALEISRRLAARGEKISFLALVDAYPHLRFLPFRQLVGLLFRRSVRRIAGLAKPPRTEIRLGGLASVEDIPTFAPAFDHVRESAFLAFRRYKPTFYPGSVKFIRAAEFSGFPRDPKAVWSHLVNDIEVQTVPGNHLAMLTTHYQDLAQVLNHYLEGALRRAGSE